MTPGQASPLTDNLFLALNIIMLGVWGAAAGIGTRAADDKPRWLANSVIYGLGALVWFLIPLMLAQRGLLDRWELPAPSMMLILAVTIFTLGLALSPFSARLIDRVPLAWLVGYQVFRVPVELLLHRLYEEGVIPVQMTYSGLNFDIVSGLGGALVAILLVRGMRSRAVIWVYNALGLLLLANIVAIAVLSTPLPFRSFMNEPANRLPGVAPYVLLPTLLVQAALFGHVVVFRALLRRPA
jgi:hypothetical protein